MAQVRGPHPLGVSPEQVGSADRGLVTEGGVTPTAVEPAEGYNSRPGVALEVRPTDRVRTSVSPFFDGEGVTARSGYRCGLPKVRAGRGLVGCLGPSQRDTNARVGFDPREPVLLRASRETRKPTRLLGVMAIPPTQVMAASPRPTFGTVAEQSRRRLRVLDVKLIAHEDRDGLGATRPDRAGF